MVDPQPRDIPDKVTILRRLDRLQQNILALKDDIPDMVKMTTILKRQLQSTEKDTQAMLALIDQLLERQQNWQEWLAGRLTFLASLRTYLEMNGSDLEDAAEEERSA
jgi:hypothetical protein